MSKETENLNISDTDDAAQPQDTASQDAGEADKDNTVSPSENNLDNTQPSGAKSPVPAAVLTAIICASGIIGGTKWIEGAWPFGPSTAQTQAQIAQLITAQQALSGQLEAQKGLSSKIADLSVSLDTMHNELAALSTAVDTLQTDVDAVQSTDAGSFKKDLADLKAQLQKQIDNAGNAYQPQLDEIEKRWKEIQPKMAEIQEGWANFAPQIAQIQEGWSSLQSQITQERLATLIDNLRRALESGRFGQKEKDTFKSATGELPPALETAHELPSLRTLQTEFADALKTQPRPIAPLAPQDTSTFWSRTKGFFADQVNLRVTGPDPSGADALSKAADAAANGEIARVIQLIEASQTPPAPKMQKWLVTAAKFAAAQKALDDVSPRPSIQ